jgi:4-amino-4-deoxy-L-arabinose transferase
VLLAALTLVLVPQLSAPPLERAEVYFMDAARAMVESGDWLVPRYQGRPFFDKPILAYWLMAAAMKALGTTSGAARAVAVAAALALVASTAWLGLLLFGRRSALCGAVVLATTVGFLSFARVAMSDMPLAVFTTLAVALSVRAWRPQPPAWLLPALGAALGLGFATKGPIALVVPGLAALVLALQERRSPPSLRAGPLALAGLAFAVLGLGWFLLAYWRLGAQPLAHFFLRENLERFAGEAYDVGRPLWFYVPAYLAEGLPWSAFLPLALARLLRGGGGSERRAAWLLALWAALVLLPLSLSRGKIDYYLLPIYPALSLLIGRFLVDVPWRRLDRWWARAVLALAVAAGAALLWRPPALPQAWLPAPGVRAVSLAVVLIAMLALAAAALWPTRTRVTAALAGATAAVFFLGTAFFLPAFAAGQPNRALAQDVARERQYVPQATLAYCDDPSRARRDVLFRARHAGVEQCDLWSLAASRQPYLLLVSPAEDASFRVLPGYRQIASYRYVPARALTLDGLLSGQQPAELVLGANFKTTDPVAEVKRKKEYRRAIRAGLEAEARARAEAARAAQPADPATPRP